MFAKSVYNFLEKNLTIGTDGVHVFPSSFICVADEQNMWGDLIYSAYKKITDDVVGYISIGGHHAAGYFKTDGQDFCVSLHIVDAKQNKCYTARVLTAWSISEILANTKILLNDIDSYIDNGSDFDNSFGDKYDWQKAINGELVSTIKKRVADEIEAKRVAAEIAKSTDPTEQLLIKIMSIASEKRSQCFCTESENKFKAIRKIITEQFPELVTK